jgi:hypothetical protein
MCVATGLCAAVTPRYHPSDHFMLAAGIWREWHCWQSAHKRMRSGIGHFSLATREIESVLPIFLLTNEVPARVKKNEPWRIMIRQ